MPGDDVASVSLGTLRSAFLSLNISTGVLIRFAYNIEYYLSNIYTIYIITVIVLAHYIYTTYILHTIYNSSTRAGPKPEISKAAREQKWLGYIYGVVYI